MKKPQIDASVFIAPGAVVVDDVTIGENCGIWYNAVLRGDSSAITVGANTNIQDNATVHGRTGCKVTIGSNVTIGHNAIVHGCTICDNVLIGMGAIIMNDAVIEENCLIGAGAMVTERKRIPAGSLVLGAPGKVIRPLTPEELATIASSAEEYVELARAKKDPS